MLLRTKLMSILSYPPDNDDKKKQLGEFFEAFPPPKIADQVPDYVKAVKEQDSSIEKLGIIGVSNPLCRGDSMTDMNWGSTAGVARSSPSVSRLTPTPFPLPLRFTLPWLMRPMPRVS